MQARRILLLMAIALLMASAAASLVPVSDETGGDEAPPTEDTTDPAAPQVGDREPAPDGGPEGPVEIGFRASEPPRTAAVQPDRRAVVTIKSSTPGQVELRGLGALQPVELGAPAVFDLFTDTTGRFEVVYTPVDGPERRLGTLVVRHVGDAARQPGKSPSRLRDSLAGRSRPGARQ